MVRDVAVCVDIELFDVETAVVCAHAEAEPPESADDRIAGRQHARLLVI